MDRLLGADELLEQNCELFLWLTVSSYIMYIDNIAYDCKSYFYIPNYLTRSLYKAFYVSLHTNITYLIIHKHFQRILGIMF